MDNLRADLDRIHTALGPKKKVDIYEVARVDPTMTIEEIMKNLVELKEEGHFKVSLALTRYLGLSVLEVEVDIITISHHHYYTVTINAPRPLCDQQRNVENPTQHIGVSEIHPTALRKAHAVHPIAAAEIEISVFNLQPEAIEVVKVAEELGIAVVAYS
jgi:pyridoxine 4-dehydrogenase